jgi:hypothetical protein
MSIAIISQPQTLTPVVNPILFVVSGSNQNQPNFRYVATVLNASGGTAAVLKSDKLPTSGNGFFDVAKVVEALIVPTIPDYAQTGWQAVTENYARYSVSLQEEYGTTPAIATGSTTASGTAFLAAFSQVDFRSYQSTNFIGVLGLGSNYDLLTNRPTTITVTSGGVGYLDGIINYTGNLRMEVAYFNSVGTSLRSFNVSAAITDGSLTFYRAAIGETNLRALTAGQCSDGLAGSSSFPTAGGYYTIRMGTSDSFVRSPTYRVNIVCKRFNSIRVHFRNKLGGYDFFDFTMKNRRDATVGRSTFGANNNAYGTEVFSSIFDGSWQDVYNLNSNWLNDAEYVWLFDLISSPQVYLEINGALIEAVIDNTNYRYITRQNDKLQPLQMAIRVAYQNELI